MEKQEAQADSSLLPNQERTEVLYLRRKTEAEEVAIREMLTHSGASLIASSETTELRQSPSSPRQYYDLVIVGPELCEEVSKLASTNQDLRVRRESIIYANQPQFIENKEALFETIAKRLSLRETLISDRPSRIQVRPCVNIDTLTSTLRAESFLEQLERARTQSTESSLYMLVCDVDRLSDINERFGKPVGDLVLTEVADALMRASRDTDIVGRVGKDEFAIGFRAQRPADAWSYGERMRRDLKKLELRMGEDSVRISASFGLVSVPSNLKRLEQLLVEASSVMMRAKIAGRHQYAVQSVFSTPTVTQRAETDALLALEQGDVTPYLQYIVNPDSGQILGGELLSRLAVPGFESPGAFYELARRTGKILLADLATMRACIRASAKLDLETHINVFPSTLVTLSDDALRDEILEHPNPERLCFEINEQELLGDPKHILRAVAGMRSLGAKIALDDVGWGRSSLENLVELAPDKVKLDRRIVHQSWRSPDSREALCRFASVARSLGADVVAEGVEDEQDCRVVVEAGIKAAQGFLWSMPAPCLD